MVRGMKDEKWTLVKTQLAFDEEALDAIKFMCVLEDIDNATLRKWIDGVVRLAIEEAKDSYKTERARRYPKKGKRSEPRSS